MSQTLKMPQPQLAATAIEKSYYKGAHQVPVLRGVRLTINKGDFVSIVGQSGSGKSTLMHLMGLLDHPDVGEIMLEGQRIDDLNERSRDQLRNRVFGFIFQFYHLLPELNLLENVQAPLMIRGSAWDFWKNRKSHRELAMDIIQKVGIEHRIKHKPSELSGGEMQRAAIARALIGSPQILLADEPTGNLDSSTGKEIMDLLKKLNEDNQLSIVMVTHDDAIASQAHRVVRLKQGQIEKLARKALDPVAAG